MRHGAPQRVAAVVGVLALVALPGAEMRTRPQQVASSQVTPSARAGERATPTTTTSPPPRSFTLAATGDVLLHEPLWDQARADAAAAGSTGLDFRPLLAGAKPLVAGADLAICHLETPVAAPGGAARGYPAFSVPPEIVPALADMGFDACSTASNHTFDQGADGVDRTLAALDAVGVRHAGSARDPADAATTTMLPVDGARVALLSYTFGFNGIPPPGGQAWRSNLIDEQRVLADASRARAEGADVVVVALHWGDEYRSEPTSQQRTMGPALVRSPDIDLVLGHHAHVVQPIEHVDGEWVVYGLGNFVAHHETPLPANEEGLLVRFTFTQDAAGWQVTQAEYAPLLVSRAGPVRLVDVGATLATGTADPTVEARLRAADERTDAAVAELGAAAHGLVPTTGP